MIFKYTNIRIIKNLLFYQSFGLAPKGKTKIYISKDETVYFNNENVPEIDVSEIISKTIDKSLEPFDHPENVYPSSGIAVIVIFRPLLTLNGISKLNIP